MLERRIGELRNEIAAALKRGNRAKADHFIANSHATKWPLDSHRMIRHPSPRPLGRRNPLIRPHRPTGLHQGKSRRPLTNFAAHWDGQSKDENL
jgi:hypothetical protein